MDIKKERFCFYLVKKYKKTFYFLSVSSYFLRLV